MGLRRKSSLLIPKIERLFLRTAMRSEEHTSELQSPCNLVCRLLLEKKKKRCVRLDESADSAGNHLLSSSCPCVTMRITLSLPRLPHAHTHPCARPHES